ncbi:UNVERIFIED_CONTAM: hypothetical protein PYX00_010812 [Menopon gallinae]|uniref:Uncharacterized protein n=1 Tax=Menopon gallinae TaxID=328185 RepID=A0AAW2H6N5_9NEOP
MSQEVLDNFTKETGIKIHSEYYKTNEDMLAKLELSPSYYDLITPSDFMIERLIKEQALAPLDLNQIPNSQYLMENLRYPSFDPKGEYSLPYAWGTLGIVYDKSRVKAQDLGSSSILWNNAYSGYIIMCDSIRETIGTALLRLGYDINTQKAEEIEEAGELLKKQRTLVMGYMGDTVKSLMGMGEATLALTWSGSAALAIRQNPNMDYFLPKEGSNYFLDSFVIPKKSKKKELAQKFINYVYQPEVAYKIWQDVGFVTPNQKAYERLPVSLQKDKRWYPDFKDPPLYLLKDLDENTLRLYNKVFKEEESVREKLLTSILLLFLVLLSACNRQMDENTLVLFTWNDYFDPQVIEDFSKEKGVKVHVEYFSTNEELLAKFENNKSYYDLLTPSDHLVDKLIQEDLLTPLDYTHIPNAKTYLMPCLKQVAYDPSRTYSLPYAWGTVGILYDKSKVTQSVDSWQILWDPKYKGQIIMTDSLRDTIGVALKLLGYSLNTADRKALEEAGALLKKQAPLLMGYFGDATEMLMSAGEASLAVMWSGEALNAMRRNPNMNYVIPKEGANLWEDDFVVPRDSRKKELAYEFINYMYRPESAYKNWQFLAYSTPNIKTFEMLPEHERNDKRWYPDLPNTRLETLRALTNKELELYNKVWLELKS